jgi:hypothetical protein
MKAECVFCRHKPNLDRWVFDDYKGPKKCFSCSRMLEPYNKELGRDFNEIVSDIKPSDYKLNSDVIWLDVNCKQHQRERGQAIIGAPHFIPG